MVTFGGQQTDFKCTTEDTRPDKLLGKKLTQKQVAEDEHSLIIDKEE